MKTKPKEKIIDVASYISQYDPEIRRRLEAIRSIGFEVFQNAEERVYFALPTFSVNGKDILHYGAYKAHISLVVGCDLAFMLKDKYPQYQYTGHTIKFLNNEDFPEDIVREICVFLAYGSR